MDLFDRVATFVFSSIGTYLAVRYILIKMSLQEKRVSDDKLRDAIVNSLNANEKRLDGVITDYEACQSENVRRDNNNLLVGSIFTSASLLILANALSDGANGHVSVYALVSIGVFSLWFYTVFRTSEKLDELNYDRIHAIEDALTKHLGYEFGIHDYILRKTNQEITRNSKKYYKPEPWLTRRRIFWSIVLLLISFAWMLLSLLG